MLLEIFRCVVVAAVDGFEAPAAVPLGLAKKSVTLDFFAAGFTMEISSSESSSLSKLETGQQCQTAKSEWDVTFYAWGRLFLCPSLQVEMASARRFLNQRRLPEVCRWENSELYERENYNHKGLTVLSLVLPSL